MTIGYSFLAGRAKGRMGKSGKDLCTETISSTVPTSFAVARCLSVLLVFEIKSAS